jgi:hypothetical protein
MVGLGLTECDLERYDEDYVNVHELKVTKVGSKIIQNAYAHELNKRVQLYELECLKGSCERGSSFSE